MLDNSLACASATELLGLIRTKQISPVELTEFFFARIDKLDARLNSFVLLARESAIEMAKEAEAAVIRGDELGPLHGLPIPIKDTQNTSGIRTTMGSLILKNRIPKRDGAVVERVKSAGAIVLGKTNVPEFALVGTCENRLGEPGRNPWNIERTPGGSSGGAAAAVAAYLCPVATGSDAGGSIRIPASFCGVYGIKPTQGRVSGYTGNDGVHMPYIFAQNGPIARTVLDAATILQILSGHDMRDPVSLRELPPDFTAAVDKNISGLRVAWSPDFGFADVDPDVLAVTSRAAKVFEDLGCHVEDSNFAMDPPYDTFGPVQAADAYATLGKYLETDGDRLTDFAKFFLEIGSRVTATEYARTLGCIDILKARITSLFEEYDLLLSPTACFTAFPNEKFPGSIRGESEYPEQYWNGAFTLPINAVGHPAATVPAGFSSDGLPIGLHIVGRWGDEETILAASAAFERAQPWTQYKPTVS